MSVRQQAIKIGRSGDVYVGVGALTLCMSSRPCSSPDPVTESSGNDLASRASVRHALDLTGEYLFTHKTFG